MAVSCESKQEKIRTLINQGVKEMYNNDIEMAEKHLQEAISLDSNNAEPYLHIGRIEFNRKNYDNSLRYINKAIEKKSNFGEAYRTKAQIYFILGNRIEACKNFRLANQNGVENLDNQLKGCP